MKLVKVQRRWKLHEYGFPVALRFDNWSMDIQRIEDWLRQNYGSEFTSYPNWKSHWGKGSYTTVNLNKVFNRPYFIGLRSEADATVLLLATT